MTDHNPYAHAQAIPASEAGITERARFLQRTYTWLLGGILGFCAVLGAYGQVPIVTQAANALAVSPLLTIVLLLGMAFGVHAIAEKHPINILGYVVYVVFFGLLIAPFVAYANLQSANVVTQASMITAITFLGLTIYVFTSGKDFSFLGGALRMGLFALIGVALAGMLFGFHLGVWYSVAGALLFCGYILYDTSAILHHYPTTAHISAAIVLFTDVVLLFKHILFILLSSRD